MSAQAGLDIAQALPVSQLCEGHTQKLIEAGKGLDLVYSAVARHATTKRRQWHMLSDLREHELAQVHYYPLRVSCTQDRKSTLNGSNRDQTKS